MKCRRLPFLFVLVTSLCVACERRPSPQTIDSNRQTNQPEGDLTPESPERPAVNDRSDSAESTKFLEKLAAKLKYDDRGQIVEIDLRGTSADDADSFLILPSNVIIFAL